MSDVLAALRDVLPPAAALICAGALYALRWRDGQCRLERGQLEEQIKKLTAQLEAAQLDARGQRDARIGEAQAIVGEYRLHVEASTSAIERLEERIDGALSRGRA